MQKFILTGIFLVLLTMIIKYPYPILEHEYLIETYQIIPTKEQPEKTTSKTAIAPSEFAKLSTSNLEKNKKEEVEKEVLDNSFDVEELLVVKTPAVLDADLALEIDNKQSIQQQQL